MNKHLISAMMVIASSFSIAQTSGGDIVDPTSKLIFTYNNVTAEVAQQELAHCQTLANHTQEPVKSNQGSGVRGLLKGAAAGAAVGAISVAAVLMPRKWARRWFSRWTRAWKRTTSYAAKQ